MAVEHPGMVGAFHLQWAEHWVRLQFEEWYQLSKEAYALHRMTFFLRIKNLKELKTYNSNINLKVLLY